jgi:beta-lactam-binding protein with PASTA domain
MYRPIQQSTGKLEENGKDEETSETTDISPCNGKVVDQKPTPEAIVKTSGQKNFVCSHSTAMRTTRPYLYTHPSLSGW